VASSPSVAKPALSVKRLTPVEVAQHRKDGQCFHCNEFFTNGHKVCKQLFCIEVTEDDDTPTNDTDMPVISIHTPTGIRPHAGRNMQLYVVINGTRITALVDSGSTCYLRKLSSGDPKS
jgi:hypothetical protein